MRYGMLLAALAAATLTVSGCKNLPASPSAPSMPEKPSEPRAGAPPAPKAEVPAKSSAPSAGNTESAIKAGAPAGKAPIKADLSKIKFSVDQADLFGYEDGESRAFFYTNGLGEVTVSVPADGDYEIVITASCQAAKGENAKFKL